MISKFSPETIEKIGSYVYSLIDPRNNEIFYIGKGKGNRVFAHAKNALKNFDGENYFNKNDNISNLKVDVIREIINEGYEVKYIIQRWNLNDEQALLIESTLIDFLQLKKITNKVNGWGHEYGKIAAEDLEFMFHCDYFEETTNTPKFIIIKIKKEVLENYNDDRFEATKRAWKVNLNRVKKYPYVLSVTNGIVKAVYKVNFWKNISGTNRKEFEGDIAEKEVENIFIGKRIPDKYSKKGKSNPILYCE